VSEQAVRRSEPEKQRAETGAACEVTDGCLTCGDIAVPLTVVEVHGTDARCRDEQGREEAVAVELVGEVTPGDRLLVHAKVAIRRWEAP
jgi:hydrogenase expression/formation protein HypC